MATVDGPLRLRVISGAIEERGGQVLATLNEGATPSMLDSFVNFIEDCAEFGPTDEVIDTLFPDLKEKTAEPSDEKNGYPHPAGGPSLQEQADEDYQDHLIYQDFKALVNQETRQMMVPTAFVLQLLRRMYRQPDEGEVTYSSAARDEVSYRNAHEDGLINMEYEDNG